MIFFWEVNPSVAQARRYAGSTIITEAADELVTEAGDTLIAEAN